MQTPGAPSLVFLAYLLGFLPWAAFRSARRLRDLRAQAGGKGGLSREAVWANVLMSQGLLFGLAWFTGRGFDYAIFAAPSFGARELLAGIATLAACFGLRSVLRALRTDEERRALLVYRLAPRTGHREAVRYASTSASAPAEGGS